VTVNTCPAIVSVAERAVVDVFSATVKVTVPLSDPEAPPVIVSHGALLTAVHAQPSAIFTETLPLPPESVNVWLTGVREAPHVPVNANVFERVLEELPEGPTAATRASYTTPGTGAGFRNVGNGTRILPSTSGVGLPRLTV
jgi:hypothetical protein